jgi:hypothetical protein
MSLLKKDDAERSRGAEEQRSRGAEVTREKFV